jgi:cell division protein FtsQ
MTAHAVVVDPRRLPVPVRRHRRRAMISASHIWVLHKTGIIRLLLAAVVCVVVIGLYEVRSTIFTGIDTLSEIVQGEFAHAGFGVGAIEITGQTLTQEADVIAALGIDPKTSTVNFDAEAARARIEALPAVQSVTIRKIYPGRVVIAITEKVPVARWRVDGVTFVVDAAGEQIGEDKGDYGDLPLVIGDGAADDAMIMIKAMERHDDLKAHLAALSRIGDRRWDMIYDTGLRVQLPEQGVAQALDRLDTYQRDYTLLDRDVTLIDLRVPNMVAVTPSKDAQKQIIAEAKARAKAAPKIHLNVDSDYETPSEASGD